MKENYNSIKTMNKDKILKRVPQIILLQLLNVNFLFAQSSVDIYTYTSGLTYKSYDLVYSTEASLQGDFLHVPIAAYDSPQCIISTKNFESTGSGTVVLSIEMKRTFFGVLKQNQSIDRIPLANIRFKRTEITTGEKSDYDYLSLKFLQKPITESIVSTFENYRHIWARDESVQTYTTVWENVAAFENGNISLCTFFQGGGIDIKSIKIYLIQ